jgi:hypothetical protein
VHAEHGDVRKGVGAALSGARSHCRMRTVEAPSSSQRSAVRIVRHGLRSGARTGWFLRRSSCRSPRAWRSLSWTGCARGDRARARAGDGPLRASRRGGGPARRGMDGGRLRRDRRGDDASADSRPAQRPRDHGPHGAQPADRVRDRVALGGVRPGSRSCASRCRSILGALMWQLLRHGSLAATAAPHAIAAGEDPSFGPSRSRGCGRTRTLVVKIFVIVVRPHDRDGPHAARTVCSTSWRAACDPSWRSWVCRSGSRSSGSRGPSSASRTGRAHHPGGAHSPDGSGAGPARLHGLDRDRALASRGHAALRRRSA